MRAKIFWKNFEPSFPSLCACACPTYSLWVINTQQKPFWISFGPWCPLRCFNLLGCMSFLRLRANAFECPNLFLFTSVCRKQTVGDVPTSWYVPCMFVLFCSCPGSQNKRETMSVKYVWNSTVNMSHNFNSQVTFGSRWLVCSMGRRQIDAIRRGQVAVDTSIHLGAVGPQTSSWLLWPVCAAAFGFCIGWSSCFAWLLFG